MLKPRIRLTLFFLTLATFSPAAVQAGTAEVINNSGQVIGTVTANGAAHGVIFRVSLNPGALSPGWHGMHLHAVGDCADIAAFKSAKSHVNHGTGQHGLLNPAGPESGDLPNLHIAADGSAQAEFWSTGVSLDAAGTALLDADGSALVIHAAEDDHLTQPIGNSGARVACSVLE